MSFTSSSTSLSTSSSTSLSTSSSTSESSSTSSTSLSSSSSTSSTEALSTSSSSESVSSSSSQSGVSSLSSSSSSSLEPAGFSSSSSSSAFTIPITFTNFVNSNTVAPGNSLTKNGGGNWAAGAESDQILNGPGYVEWTVDDITNSRKMGGLSPNPDPFDGTRRNIVFGLMQRNNDFIVRENNTNVFTENNLTAINDIFRIQVWANGTVEYSKNGVVLYTSALTASFPLKVDVSIRDTGAILTDVVLHGDWS